ncbi:MAG: hypothetical protein NZ920_01570 [Aigarchaeota archaeon]|nr:hypothetical protein [Aigarchaeota archaeon]MDW8093131.1 hypothetical protein [Nitrososphaerota archaeon]
MYRGHIILTVTIILAVALLTLGSEVGASTTRSFTLYLNDYGYNASKGGPLIVVNQGDLVRIRLIGNGSGPVVHDFALDEYSPSPYSIRSNRLSRGQVQVIEFVANHPGEFKYYCSVAPAYGESHRSRGQEGTIVVRATAPQQDQRTTVTETRATTVTDTVQPQSPDVSAIIVIAAVLAVAIVGVGVWLIRSRSRR